MDENITAPFYPLPWQIEPWRDKSPIMLLTGSAGGGKSRLAAEKIHGFCKKYPGSTWLMMRKAREWTGKSLVPFYSDTVIGDDSNVRLLKSEGAFKYSNGSTVYVGGMKDDDQREAIRSIGGSGGLDGAWMEEANAFTRQDYEEVLGRLRGNAGGWRQLILTTNPGGSMHWIYRDLIKGNQARVYYSGAVDNPNNPDDYITSLNSMTGVMYKRLVLGLWVQSEGAVYDNFDRASHVIERSVAEFQRWGLALDEGYTNPAVILLIGIDGDGRWHIMDEFYRRGVLQEKVCAAAYDFMVGYNNLNIVAVDAAAAGLIADLRNHGINALPAKGRVLDGIQAIQNRLRLQGDGKPRLTVDPSCINTISEFESYEWKPDKDEPVKENDHAMDAIRYFSVLAETSPLGGVW